MVVKKADQELDLPLFLRHGWPGPSVSPLTTDLTNYNISICVPPRSTGVDDLNGVGPPGPLPRVHYWLTVAPLLTLPLVSRIGAPLLALPIRERRRIAVGE